VAHVGARWVFALGVRLLHLCALPAEWGNLEVVVRITRGLMGREGTDRTIAVAELLGLQQNHEQCNDVLGFLFDLLERYAPPWFTREHHEAAAAALT
jgi:hypothetical protein